MELLALFLSALSLVAVAIAGMLVRNYLPAYLAEKGKTAASKEDVAHLTGLVEGVKSLHVTELERHKAALLLEGKVIERRRQVYEEMCAALRIFQSGHNGKNVDGRERFHAAHAAAWLWASDSVLVALNEFIEIQVQHASKPGSVDQKLMRDSYADVITAMRKDAGFPITSLTAANYQFVQF